MTALVIGEVSADGSQIILMATGADHEMAKHAKRLEFVTPLVSHTQPAGALSVPLSWPNVVQLSAEFGAAWRPGPRLTDWVTQQFISRVTTPDQSTADAGELTVAPPAGLVPRPYQVAGARMIGLVGSCLLFDDQGTGKTVTAVLGLRERIAAGHVTLPVLVICPASVVDSWVKHVHEWAPELRAVAWRGSPKRRRNLMGTADVYVASYGTVTRDAGSADTRNGHNPLVALRPTYVIADEVHKIKAQSTAQSRAVQRLAERASSFIGMSGTPITHHPGDLWPALFCYAPGAFPSRERWLSRYCDVSNGSYSVDEVFGLNPLREPEFRSTLLGAYRRVSKADVLSHLPPKVYSVRQVELPEQYRKAYKSLEQDMLAALPDDGGALEPMTVLAQINNLVSLANAAADVHTWTEIVEDPVTGQPTEKRHQNITLRMPSWKVDEQLEVMTERPGQQFIIAAPSKQLVDLGAQAAADAGYRVGHIVGGQSPRERTRNVDAFQAGDLDLIAVSTGAGGVGLTLTAASCLIFLQRPWSMVEAIQMEDRAHRIGSEIHDSIDIVDIVAANTIESRMRAKLVDKAQNLSDLVQDPRIVTELLGGAEVRDLRRKAVRAA